MRKLNKKIYLLIFFFIILLAMLASLFCFLPFNKGLDEKRDERRCLVLYSSLKTVKLSSIESYFETLYPDIDLVFYSTSSSNVVQLVENEAMTDKRICDLIWCAEPYGYLELIDNNMLSALNLDYSDLPTFANVDNNYMAIARLIRIAIAVNVNDNNDKNTPKSFDELLKCDSVLLADPASSGSSLYTITELASLYGWDYFKTLKANGAKIVNGSNASVYQVKTGEGKATIAPDYIISSAIAMGSQIKLIDTLDASIMIPSPIAIVKGCNNEEDAKTFLAFILSDAGQAMLYSIDITPSRGEYANKEKSSFVIQDEENTLSKFDEIFLD